MKVPHGTTLCVLVCIVLTWFVGAAKNDPNHISNDEIEAALKIIRSKSQTMGGLDKYLESVMQSHETTTKTSATLASGSDIVNGPPVLDAKAAPSVSDVGVDVNAEHEEEEEEEEESDSGDRDDDDSLSDGGRHPHEHLALPVTVTPNTRRVGLAPDTPRIPKLIHQIWITEDTPPTSWMETWSNGFVGMYKGWSYRLWTDADLTGRAGAIFENDNDRRLYVASDPRPCHRADVLRLFILKRYGGVYIDADSVWLPGRSMSAIFLSANATAAGFVAAWHPHKLIPSSGSVPGSDLKPRENLIANGVMGSIANHKVLWKTLDVIKARLGQGYYGWEGFGTGPLTEAINLLGQNYAFLVEPAVFYPGGWMPDIAPVSPRSADRLPQRIMEVFPSAVMVQHGYSSNRLDDFVDAMAVDENGVYIGNRKRKSKARVQSTMSPTTKTTASVSNSVASTINVRPITAPIISPPPAGHTMPELLIVGDLNFFENRMDKHYWLALQEISSRRKGPVYVVGTGTDGFYAGMPIRDVIDTFCETEFPIVMHTDVSYDTLVVVGLDDYKGAKGIEIEDDHRTEVLSRLINGAGFDTVIHRYNSHKIKELKTECPIVQRWFHHPFAFNLTRYESIREEGHYNKTHDICLTGCVAANIYPFRARLNQLITNQYQKYRLNVHVVPHPGYEVKDAPMATSGDRFFRILAHCHAAVVTPSIMDYMLKKYYETILTGTLMIGNPPTTHAKKLSKLMAVVTADMSDVDIMEAIHEALSNRRKVKRTVKAALSFAENANWEQGAARYVKFIAKIGHSRKQRNGSGRSKKTNLESEAKCEAESMQKDVSNVLGVGADKFCVTR